MENLTLLASASSTEGMKSELRRWREIQARLGAKRQQKKEEKLLRPMKRARLFRPTLQELFRAAVHVLAPELVIANSIDSTKEATHEVSPTVQEPTVADSSDAEIVADAGCQIGKANNSEIVVNPQISSLVIVEEQVEEQRGMQPTSPDSKEPTIIVAVAEEKKDQVEEAKASDDAPSENEFSPLDQERKTREEASAEVSNLPKPDLPETDLPKEAQKSNPASANAKEEPENAKESVAAVDKPAIHSSCDDSQPKVAEKLQKIRESGKIKNQNKPASTTTILERRSDQQRTEVVSRESRPKERSDERKKARKLLKQETPIAQSNKHRTSATRPEHPQFKQSASSAAAVNASKLEKTLKTTNNPEKRDQQIKADSPRTPAVRAEQTASAKSKSEMRRSDPTSERKHRRENAQNEEDERKKAPKRKLAREEVKDTSRDDRKREVAAREFLLQLGIQAALQKEKEIQKQATADLQSAQQASKPAEKGSEVAPQRTERASSSQSQQEEKKKTAKRRMTREQHAKLNEVFAKKRKLDFPEREDLAKELGVEVDQVTNWFNYKRHVFKNKRSSTPEPESPPKRAKSVFQVKVMREGKIELKPLKSILKKPPTPTTAAAATAESLPEPVRATGFKRRSRSVAPSRSKQDHSVSRSTSKDPAAARKQQPDLLSTIVKSMRELHSPK